MQEVYAAGDKRQVSKVFTESDRFQRTGWQTISQPEQPEVTDNTSMNN